MREGELNGEIETAQRISRSLISSKPRLERRYSVMLTNASTVESARRLAVAIMVVSGNA